MKHVLPDIDPLQSYQGNFGGLMYVQSGPCGKRYQQKVVDYVGKCKSTENQQQHACAMRTMVYTMNVSITLCCVLAVKQTEGKTQVRVISTKLRAQQHILGLMGTYVHVCVCMCVYMLLYTLHCICTHIML